MTRGSRVASRVNDQKDPWRDRVAHFLIGVFLVLMLAAAVAIAKSDRGTAEAAGAAAFVVLTTTLAWQVGTESARLGRLAGRLARAARGAIRQAEQVRVALGNAGRGFYPSRMAFSAARRGANGALRAGRAVAAYLHHHPNLVAAAAVLAGTAALLIALTAGGLAGQRITASIPVPPGLATFGLVHPGSLVQQEFRTGVAPVVDIRLSVCRRTAGDVALRLRRPGDGQPVREQLARVPAGPFYAHDGAGCPRVSMDLTSFPLPPDTPWILDVVNPTTEVEPIKLRIHRIPAGQLGQLSLDAAPAERWFLDLDLRHTLGAFGFVRWSVRTAPLRTAAIAGTGLATILATAMLLIAWLRSRSVARPVVALSAGTWIVGGVAAGAALMFQRFSPLM